MNLIVYTGGLEQANGYLFLQGADSVLIDAPAGCAGWLAERLAEEPRGALQALILTHGHYDHIYDASHIKKTTGCEILAHEADRKMMTTPLLQTLFGAPLVKAVTPDRTVAGGERLKFGNLEMRVEHVPGHTPGHIALVVEKEKAVFTGDLIFAGSVGRTDFPGGSFEALLDSIREKIISLPDDFTIYPGHGPKTTVAREDRTNPFINDFPARDGDGPEWA